MTREDLSMRSAPLVGRWRDDQGGVELFVLVVVMAIVLALGIITDLGGRMRTADRAAWTAQQAARAASSQVSGAGVQDGAAPVVSAQDSVATAQRVVAAAGMSGTASVYGDTVTVTVSTTYTPMILSIAGRPAWSVSETATAQIVRGISAPQ